MTKKNFTWVEFYQEFADKLLEYKDNREELIKKVRKVFSAEGLKLPTLETDNQIEDIDPFTIFGTFNKSLKTKTRIKIAESIAEVFKIEAPIPEDFRGIPVLNPLNSTYYYFVGARGEDDIDNLWNLYESALDYKDEDSDENLSRVAKYFDLVINTKGIGNAKITMGLFWVAPESFINLDSVNKEFIYRSDSLDEDFRKSLPEMENLLKAATYFEILEKLKEHIYNPTSEFRGFPDFSYKAWKYSNEKEVIEPGVGDGPIRYWLYSPGDAAFMWEEFYEEGIMGIGWDYLGDLEEYASKEAIRTRMRELRDPEKSYMHDAHATWQFTNEMQVGDIIFVKKGRTILVGSGVVTSDYIFDETREDKYKHIRQVDWIHKDEWALSRSLPMKTLTECSDDINLIAELNEILELDEDIISLDGLVGDYDPYTREEFLDEVYMESENYDDLVALLKRKKNIILQGSPGVGKTFIAKRLAYSMMGEKDASRVTMVQFHQSYSYEDFIEGFRPTSTGFDIDRGAFYNFCKEADKDDRDRKYFFIIDEINRGNLSKIFGELFMLIEEDKRDLKLNLLYSSEKFSVPSNVYIIGMMNTADRSLAMLDYALRRRFAFFEMTPGFDSRGFVLYQKDLKSERFDRLVSLVKELNKEIIEDDSLGEGFVIGHSYLCNLKPGEGLRSELVSIVDYELIPLLKEYWFDEPSKVRNWSERLRDLVQ